MNINILVTGSSGYVGGSFLKNFKNKYNILTFSLQHDTLENINLNHIEAVLHCAALVHQKNKYNFEKYHEINVEYPVSLAKRAKRDGVKHFIFISTIAVYGEDNEYIDKKTDPSPISDYGKTKLEAENELRKIEDRNFTVSIIRLPMVYGENAPGNIATLVKIIQKIPILPFAKIENKRSFIYIHNLIYLIDKILEKKKGGIFLVSDDKPISTTELIEHIGNAFNKKIYLIKVPFFDILLKKVKPSLYKKLYKNLEINNSQTKKILHLKSPYSVEEGIKKMIHGENV